MCLSRLLRVDEISDDGAHAYQIEDGRRSEVSLAVLLLDDDPPTPGDWLLVSTGLAVHRLDPEQAAEIATARAMLTEDPA